MKRPQLEIRVLVLVFMGIAALFAFTTVLAHWYKQQQHERAVEAFRRGQEQAQAGKHEQAIESYQNALAVSRSSTEYRVALARSLMQVGRNSEASLHLQEVLRADPAGALPNLLLARIAASEGRVEAAIDYYHRATFGYWRIDPQANRLAARWELVGLLSATRQTKQVIAELISISDEAPANPDVQSRVAGMLIERGAPDPDEPPGPQRRARLQQTGRHRDVPDQTAARESAPRCSGPHAWTRTRGTGEGGWRPPGVGWIAPVRGAYFAS
jgi:tetratricopeptide (TPR) repeat protein